LFSIKQNNNAWKEKKSVREERGREGRGRGK
jgi:hypothetical protein